MGLEGRFAQWMEPAPSSLRAGGTLGSYVLTRQRPDSSRGCLWDASTVDGRAVVVKVYPETPAIDDERVWAAARFLATLDAPHVVRVEAGGVVDGQPYLVLEALDGLNALELASHLNARGLPSLRAALELARGAAVGALAYQQHTEGPHGAIAPHNVVVTAAGRAVLVDPPLFGERPVPADAVDLAFLAPEHEPVAPPVSVDVWGVGALLRWAVSGEAPVRLGRPRAVPAAISGLPPDVAYLLDVTLAPNPRHRVTLEQLVALLYSAAEAVGPDASLRTLVASLPPRSGFPRAATP